MHPFVLSTLGKRCYVQQLLKNVYVNLSSVYNLTKADKNPPSKSVLVTVKPHAYTRAHTHCENTYVLSGSIENWVSNNNTF